MTILGIIAEYDPFHNGHLFHLAGARRLVSPDLTFIALSPCVKQRGELSLLSPSDRAACALSAGADAVFALPVLWTVRDAEHYALGAVSLLSKLGATHLAFGAETPDLSLLNQAADLLESGTKERGRGANLFRPSVTEISKEVRSSERELAPQCGVTTIELAERPCSLRECGTREPSPTFPSLEQAEQLSSFRERGTTGPSTTFPSPDIFLSTLKDRLSAGAGYPSAVSAALSAALPGAEGLLDRPNNILAVSYLRAIRRLGVSLEPVVIPRSGSYHAADIDPESPSASALRESLSRGSYEAAFSAVPEETAALLRRRYLEGRVPYERVLDALLLSRLRSMDGEALLSLPDVSEGMENALASAAASVNTRRELIAALTGKRYPAARISRLCACALLGITAEQTENAPLPDHALLLGLRKDPRMTAFWKDLPIPVISSFTEWKKAAHPADLAAWRLWAQCCRLPDTLPFSEKIVSI